MTTGIGRLSAALADRYRIERELGQGGMATVYLVEDLKHKRKVALKVLKPELAAVLGAERFVQEITTTAKKGELPAMAVLAAALEKLGDHSAAVEQLERAVRQPDAWLQMYNRSARYDALRRDPRGNAALASIETW